MENVCAMVMAAGENLDMESARPRLVHPLNGKPIIRWVADALAEAGASDQLYIVGKDQRQIRMALGEDKAYVLQDPPLGTGNACLQAASFLESREGCTLVVSGDVPLITAATLQKLVDTFQNNDCSAVVLSALADDPADYGRILLADDGRIERVVEACDATPAELAIELVNAGVYCFDNARLLSGLGRVITDRGDCPCNIVEVINDMVANGENVLVQRTPFREIVGVNNRSDLQQAALLMNRRIIAEHMKRGVTVLSPDSVIIEADVEIGRDTTILPGSHLGAGTSVGEGVIIGSGCSLRSCQVGDRVKLERSVLDDCVVGNDCQIGAFSDIRDQSILMDKVVVDGGAFISHSIVGRDSLLGHRVSLRYVKIGESSELGDGVMAGERRTNDNAPMMILGSHVKVGNGVCMMGNLSIGAHTVVSDGVVVRASVAEFAFVKGRKEPKVILDQLHRG